MTSRRILASAHDLSQACRRIKVTRQGPKGCDDARGGTAGRGLCVLEARAQRGKVEDEGTPHWRGHIRTLQCPHPLNPFFYILFLLQSYTLPYLGSRPRRHCTTLHIRDITKTYHKTNHRHKRRRAKGEQRRKRHSAPEPPSPAPLPQPRIDTLEQLCKMPSNVTWTAAHDVSFSPPVPSACPEASESMMG